MSLSRATIFVSLSALLSRLLGVWRENLLASTFGALGAGNTHALDAYYAAFRIPDFLYNLVIMSVGAAIFVPLFAKEYQNNRGQINQVVSNFLNVAGVILLFGSGLIFLFLPWGVPALTPGFSEETRALTYHLVQIMLLSPLLFGLSSVVSSYLSVHKNFTAYVWSPLLYNAAIIVSIFLLVPRWGIYGLAYGVVIGAALHLLVQLRPLWQKEFRYHWVCNFRTPAVKEVGKLVLPRIIGMSAAQLNLVVDTVIASTMAAGSLTILNWTQNLQYLPIGLIGISLSITAFTLLSDFAALDDRKRFHDTLWRTSRAIIFLSLPMTIGLFLLRFGVVDLVLNYGKFRSTAGNLELTATALGVFALSMIFQSLIPLLTRAFYAYQDTKTPVITSVLAVVVNVICSLIFAKWLGLGVMGLALSFTIANTLNALLLLYFLQKNILPGMLSWPSLKIFLSKTLLASLGMGIVVWLVQVGFAGFFSGGKVMLLVGLGVSVGIGALVFFLLSKWLKIKETDEVMRRVWRKR